MENFEQLKARVNCRFEEKEEIPQEVQKLTREIFNNLREKYKEMGCFTPYIQEYMQGNLDELMVTLKKGIGDRRKNEQFDDIQSFLSAVERELEEKIDSEEQKQRDNKNKDKIGEIANDTPNNIRTTLNTMDVIEEYLRDVQSRQIRILDSRGLYSQSQIEDINEEIRYFIINLRNQNEERLHELYQLDNEKLRKQILQDFEEYLEQRDNKEKHSNPFKEGLSIKGEYSLEQQRLDAQKRNSEEAFKGRNEEEKEYLADTLPECIL